MNRLFDYYYSGIFLFIEMKSSLKLDNYSTKDLVNMVIQLWWYYYYYYYLLQWGVFQHLGFIFS